MEEPRKEAAEIVKMLEVRRCGDCRYCNSINCSAEMLSGYARYCMHSQKRWGVIPDWRQIPEWCPLPDAPDQT